MGYDTLPLLIDVVSIQFLVRPGVHEYVVFPFLVHSNGGDSGESGLLGDELAIDVSFFETFEVLRTVELGADFSY